MGTSIENIFSSLDPGLALTISAVVVLLFLGSKAVGVYRDIIHIAEGRNKLELEKIKLEIVKLKRDLEYSESELDRSYLHDAYEYEAANSEIDEHTVSVGRASFYINQLFSYLFFVAFSLLALVFLGGVLIEGEKKIDYYFGIVENNSKAGTLWLAIVGLVVFYKIARMFLRHIKSRKIYIAWGTADDRESE